MAQIGKTIAPPPDLTEWLIGKATRHHGRDYRAALVQVLREAKAREEHEAVHGKRVSEPVDLWAGITAEARTRRSR